MVEEKEGQLMPTKTVDPDPIPGSAGSPVGKGYPTERPPSLRSIHSRHGIADVAATVSLQMFDSFRIPYNFDLYTESTRRSPLSNHGVE